MWGRLVILATPDGHFRFAERGLRSELRVKDAALLWRIAFFAECRLMAREPEFLAAVLELQEEEYPRYTVPNSPELSRAELEELSRWLVRGLRTGTVTVVRMPEPRTRPLPVAPVDLPVPPEMREESRSATFIGVRLVDQDGELVTGARVRITLPDGSVREGRTNREGVFQVTGFEEAGDAEIVLLDFATPGEAEPPPESDEEVAEVRVVDPLGQPLSGVWLRFQGGRHEQLVVTDSDGIARYPSSFGPPPTVSFESPAMVATALRAKWKGPFGAERSSWLTPDESTEVLVLRDDSLLRELPDQPGQHEVFESRPVTPGQPLTLSLQPDVVLVRLLGLGFDTNKSFLLPTALPAMRQLRELYETHPNQHLLVVGHADPSETRHDTDILSLERSLAVLAFLSDDVDSWLLRYDPLSALGAVWGEGEDRLMIKGLVARKQGLTSVDVKAYQEWHNALSSDQRARNWEYLEDDGELGPLTRAQLIGDYMNLDGTTLPPGMRIGVHGAGANFPIPEPETGAAWERFSEQRNRRVEFFFFDGNTGILPAPANVISAPAAPEYLAWREWARVEDWTTDAALRTVTFVEMHDVLFRTNSAMVLPEGEDPTVSPSGRALTTVGLVATLLRYNEEHPDHIDASGNAVRKKLLIAGHTDTKGQDSYNDPLSRERAEVVLCLVMGPDYRGTFGSLCMNRYDGIDLTQVFHWVADAYGFDCKPSVRDQRPHANTVKRFKNAYNAAFDSMFADVDGATKFPEPVTAAEDVALFAAIFDCYEVGLRDELGEDKDGVQALRDLLVWADPEHMTMGFGERFPIDNLGRNEYRSQANRRVEILMFDEGEVPDFAAMEVELDSAELYLPGAYVRRPVEAMVSAKAKRSQIVAWLRSNSGCVPLSNRKYRIDLDGDVREGMTNGEGLVSELYVRAGDYVIEVEGIESGIPSRSRGAAPVVHVMRGLFLRETT